ncbi:unnamed protein product, partial [Heterosigma akashiwo]
MRQTYRILKGATVSKALPKLTVNYMCLQQCNMKCKYCYSTFKDDPIGKKKGLDTEQALQLINELNSSGLFNKITFAGGEPFLRGDILSMVREAKNLGLLTCVVTNAFASEGSRFEKTLRYVDQLAVSFDSGLLETRASIGRALKGVSILRNRKYFYALALAREMGISTKLNTVINAYNWQEDMAPFIETMSPDRWKVFQALPVQGQNDEHFNQIRVTQEQFNDFCKRHAGLNPVVENNEMMTGSYVMIDPWGRFFDNSKGRHTYSRSILEVGVAEALSDVSFDLARYVERGGVYDLAAN